jgi:hypothetical protein
MTRACDPSYQGGREQEDQGLRPAQAKVCWHRPVFPAICESKQEDLGPRLAQTKTLGITQKISKDKKGWDVA